MTLSEENHLKAIFHLYNEKKEEVNTNAIAEVINTKASSVTDMLKKTPTATRFLTKKAFLPPLFKPY